MSRLLRKWISGSGLPARTDRRRIGDFGFCAMTGAPPASAFRRRPGWRAKKEARRERRPRSCVNLAQLHRADLTLAVSLITATPNRVIFDGIETIFGKSQGIQGGFRNVSLGGWRRSAATVISLSLRQLEGYSLGQGDNACAVRHRPSALPGISPTRREIGKWLDLRTSLTVYRAGRPLFGETSAPSRSPSLWGRCPAGQRGVPHGKPSPVISLSSATAADRSGPATSRARPTGSPDCAQSGRPTAHLPRLFSRHDCAGF